MQLPADEALADRERRAAQEVAGRRDAPQGITTAEDLEAAAQHADTQPTEAQKKAGNYQKSHVKLHGLDITIENPKGSTRTGTDRNGTEWSVDMPAHYGYVKRTVGADGDHVDVYIGDNPASDTVFIVDQIGRAHV